MIGNKAIIGRTNRGESADHFQTKVITGQIADQTLASITKAKVLTLYEFPFIPLDLKQDQVTDWVPRSYVGDIVIAFFYNIKLYRRMHEKISIMSWADIQMSADYMWDIEIDGKRGHGTEAERKKMRIRDEALLSHYNIPVLRIPWFNAKQRKQQDTYQAIIEEIKDFYVLHRPDVRQVIAS